MEKAIMDARQEEKEKGYRSKDEEPQILEEVDIEEIFIDGICGVY